MAVSNELFLLSCINHANKGKIDFDAVAKECIIPTKNAASMRFKRFKDKQDLSLLKMAQGDNDREAEDDDSEVSKPPKTLKKKRPTGAKKRKAEQELVKEERDGEN